MNKTRDAGLKQMRGGVLAFLAGITGVISTCIANGLCMYALHSPMRSMRCNRSPVLAILTVQLLNKGANTTKARPGVTQYGSVRVPLVKRCSPCYFPRATIV